MDVIPGTLLSRILGEDHASIAVNSMHHQAIKDLAPGLEVCGYAPDKMIEAVYAPDYPFLLGVQCIRSTWCPRSRRRQSSSRPLWRHAGREVIRNHS